MQGLRSLRDYAEAAMANSAPESDVATSQSTLADTSKAYLYQCQQIVGEPLTTSQALGLNYTRLNPSAQPFLKLGVREETKIDLNVHFKDDFGKTQTHRAFIAVSNKAVIAENEAKLQAGAKVPLVGEAFISPTGYVVFL